MKVHGKYFFTSLTGTVNEKCGYGSRRENFVKMRGKDFERYSNPFFKAKCIEDIQEVCRCASKKEIDKYTFVYDNNGINDSDFFDCQIGDLCEFLTGKSISFIGIIIGPVNLFNKKFLKITILPGEVDFYTYLTDLFIDGDHYYSIGNVRIIRKIMKLRSMLKPGILNIG